jgi:isocitrate/isopropylmalate dehydrogenase
MPGDAIGPEDINAGMKIIEKAAELENLSYNCNDGCL